MQEYNDCLNRCKHLAKSCDLLAASCDRNSAQKMCHSCVVESEDVLVFLRWTVFHQHTTRRNTSFIAVRKGEGSVGEGPWWLVNLF